MRAIADPTMMTWILQPRMKPKFELWIKREDNQQIVKGSYNPC